MQTVLIANRGEIAIRIAKTCKKLGFVPCAVYSEADRYSLHVKCCDRAFNIGGSLPNESYLDMFKIVEGAKKMGCDMVHPGYGFLAEKPEFAELCGKEGFVFVGPSSCVLKLSGNKILAKKTASQFADVAEGKELSDVEEALSLADTIGYPLIIKAVKGGGGRGLRVVNTDEDLRNYFEISKEEAKTSFGSGGVFIEKYLQNPKHIEVQVIGDKSHVIHLGERECSVQRRHQKLIEETPSTALTPGTREELTSKAIKIMKEIKYDNAGTVEFLFKDGKFYFMEINPRIQVEHPITEMVTGIDIVEQQLSVASGKGLPLEQDSVRFDGHAIECRINAEHPLTFAPYPGLVKQFLPPKNERIRIETSLYPGYSIPPFYDSLVAKVVCWGESRDCSIRRMRDTLRSFRITGIPSTIPFHLSALSDERFANGSYDTSFAYGVNLQSVEEEGGEIAAAVFATMAKRVQFAKDKDAVDLWLESRHHQLFRERGSFAYRYFNSIKRWLG